MAHGAHSISSAAEHHNEFPHGKVVLYVWIYFNLISSTILLPILVLTFIFSKRAKRHPTLVNLCIIWIFSGVFDCLLFFAKQHIGPEPDKQLCIVQAALINGISPMWTVATLMMMMYMALALNGDASQAVLSPFKLTLILFAPYIAQCTFTIASLIIANDHLSSVTRKHRYFYCTVNFSLLSKTMYAFTALVSVAIIWLQCYLVMIMFRIWRGLRNAGHTSRVNALLLSRVVIFGLYVTSGMVVSLLQISDNHTIAPDLYAASFGTIIFLVFGTQADVLRTWCFWIREETPPAIHPTEKPSTTWITHTVDPTKSFPETCNVVPYAAGEEHRPSPIFASENWNWNEVPSATRHELRKTLGTVLDIGSASRPPTPPPKSPRWPSTPPPDGWLDQVK